MADVYKYVEPEGVIIPDTEVINNGVITEFKSLFGADLIVTPNTPQGLLITAETTARDSVATNNATLANQINPNLAGGIFLDAIAALTGTQRTAASFSLVTGTVAGVPGTIIPAGSLARENVFNHLFQTVTMVTIPVTGSIDVQFQAVDPGPIACTAGTLVIIVSVVIGWETVTNAAAAVLGTDTQTDDQMRAYRRATLALQGQALPQAILAGLFATPNVKSATFRENTANTTQVIDGVTMVAHSIYACVDGGTDLDVATVLLNKKSGGCAYNNGAPGATPVTVPIVDPYSGQLYNILFDRPELIPIYAQVTYSGGQTDPGTTIKNAIVNYANGLIPNEPGLIVGADVSPFEFAGAVLFYDTTIFIEDVGLSLTPGGPYTSVTIPIEVFQKATIDAASITAVPA
jgi:hypothetical protein